MIALIATVVNRNVIGYQGQIPWECIPCDLQHFNGLTMNCPVVMGYNRFVSVSKMFPKDGIFPGRTSFVLTREPRKIQPFEGCVAIQNIDFVFEIAEKDCVCVIGGGSVYQQFIDKANIAYVTRINADFEGDAFFPPFSPHDWERLSSDPAHDSGYNLSFETWTRGYKRPPMLTKEFAKLSCPTQSLELVTRLR